jgi:hypothetical protein
MVKERFVGSIAASVVLTGVAVGLFFMLRGIYMAFSSDGQLVTDGIAIGIFFAIFVAKFYAVFTSWSKEVHR